MPSSKQLIQDTAVRLFNERGYDKVSLRDIAREAGVAIGSLTYHFRRKEDLLDAILADLHGGFEASLDRGLRGEALLANLVGLFVANEENQALYPFYFQDVTQVARCSERVAEDARRFEGDLYDSTLTVEFGPRLRDICRFDNVPTLVEQLRADREAARRLLQRGQAGNMKK